MHTGRPQTNHTLLRAVLEHKPRHPESGDATKAAATCTSPASAAKSAAQPTAQLQICHLKYK